SSLTCRPGQTGKKWPVGISGSLHGTRQHGVEIENNIRLIRSACIAIEQPGFNSSLHKFTDDIQRSKRATVSDLHLKPGLTYIRLHIRDTDVIKLK
ncbi:unnamed protein product, partial [Rotaria magnacalcarata]